MHLWTRAKPVVQDGRPRASYRSASAAHQLLVHIRRTYDIELSYPIMYSFSEEIMIQ